MGERVFDVLLTTTAPHHFGSELLESFPPIAGAIPIEPREKLRIERRPREWNRQVLDACSPPGFEFNPIDHESGAYAFIRADPPGSSVHWDPDQAILHAAALSRLIHPSDVTTAFAAKVTEDGGGKVVRIVPGPVTGYTTTVYLSPNLRRRWITGHEAEQLAKLYRAFRKIRQSLPKRVNRAMLLLDFCQYVELINIRWALLSTAVESLLNTSKEANAQQFIMRATALATELSVPGFGPGQAKHFWNFRSRLVHGSYEHMKGRRLELYDAAEHLLRTTVRRAIEDPAFAAHFESGDTINKHWPVAATPRSRRRQPAL